MRGRHFLQIPGPTNVPDRILRAMDRPVIDHRGPALPPVVHEVVAGLKEIFQTSDGQIVLFPSSGTGAWEAALLNTLDSGDRVLAFNIGQFSHLWAQCASRLGFAVDEIDLPWGDAVPADLVRERLAADRAGRDQRSGEGAYRAVLVVHNETSTGVTSDVATISRAIRETRHDALLIVDAISSLASIDLRFDDWGIDVALTGTQKGLMLPPGMSILCAGPRAIEWSRRSTAPRYYFDWGPVLEELARGYFPYTPATLMLYGLREAVRMLQEEALPNVFARHARLAEAVRRAVRAWELPLICRDPARYSNTLTAFVLPEGIDGADVLRLAEERLHLSLGTGLGRLRGRAIRIGHLGALNELEVLATIAGTEMALHLAGAPMALGTGVTAAETFLAERPLSASLKR